MNNTNLVSAIAAMCAAISSFVSYTKAVSKKTDLDKESIQILGTVVVLWSGMVTFLISNLVLTSISIDRTKKDIERLNGFLKNHPFNHKKEMVEGVTFLSNEESAKHGKELQDKINKMLHNINK